MYVVTVLVIGVLCFIHSTFSLTDSEKNLFAAGIELVETGEVYQFFSSGYPDHDIDNSVNPNSASTQDYRFNITITPNNDGDTVWCIDLGPVGFAKNGVAIYNALTSSSTDANVYEEFDNCKGHSSPSGSYHYHQFPSCVGDITTDDEFIGIAIDGNPIYGPKASDKTELLTSADLDACHGRFVGGKYRYHITEDFPYIIGCYKAEPAESAAGGAMGPPPGGMMGRRKRQTTEATCTNTEYGAELCDCTDGTLTQCDTLTDADKDDCDDGENGASYQHVSMFILVLQVCFMILG